MLPVRSNGINRSLSDYIKLPHVQHGSILRKGLFIMRASEIIILCIVAMLSIGSVFWIWMLIDCVLNRAIKQGPKTLWIVFILLSHWIGALIYFFTGRRLRNRANQVGYQPHAQSQEPYQVYQHGYHSPESSFDRNKIPGMNPGSEQQQYQQPQFHGDQPQASYPEHQQ